jgi:carbamoyltransferase
VLRLAGRTREDVLAYGIGEETIAMPEALVTQRFPHHLAHALTAYLTSPFREAAVLVCDGSDEQISVWRGTRDGVVNCNWPHSSQGLAAIYSQCAALFGFGERQEHRLEGLARLHPGADEGRLGGFFQYIDGRIVVDGAWRDYVRNWLGTNGPTWSPVHGARVAAAFQHAMVRLLHDVIGDLHRAIETPNLCLCGGLFFNTFLNTAISESGVFDNTFVAPNPGNTGLAAGVAMAAGSRPAPEPHPVSPFLGPSFDSEEIKRVLDNCKLSYGYFSEKEVIDQVVSALTKGHLVGWFQGPMEWGHRALGNRSILASPHSPHVVENLNIFLKHRPMYTAYGVSVCEDDAAAEFCGPRRSTWMEYDFAVLDRERLRHVLPEGTRTLRVQTIADNSSPFWQLHKAFGLATHGTGALINTSFNGFSEPIVCSPRDAIRVFFGTGLDLLAIGRFILRK